MSDRKEHIKVLKQFLKDYQEWGESLELEESVKFAINSLEVDEAYQLEYEHIPYITLDELKEIGEGIDQKQYDYMADKDYDEGIRFGLMLAYQSIDKKISELEGKE